MPSRRDVHDRRSACPSGLVEHWTGRLTWKRLPKSVRSHLPRPGSVKLPSSTAEEVWRFLCDAVLFPELPFEVHRAVWQANFCKWDAKKLGPAPAWLPSLRVAESTNAARLIRTMSDKGLFHAGRLAGVKGWARAYASLNSMSIADSETFFACLLQDMGVQFRVGPRRIFDPVAKDKLGQETWLPGARMNIADTCFVNAAVGDPKEQVAVVWGREARGADALEAESIRSWTFEQLFARSCRIANCLRAIGVVAGSRVAVTMPMTAESVAIYLAVVMAGGAVVGVADSFSAPEMQTRLEVAKADVVVTQDSILRGAKRLPLYPRVAQACDAVKRHVGRAVQVVCIPAGMESGFEPGSGGPGAPALACRLRPGDLAYSSLLGKSSGEDYSPAACSPQDVTNVLFSSGTTGTPKAIPWDHVAPIKCATDARMHMDVQSNDVVCWPTNLGWMMGPWLIYAALLNGAAVAIYEGSPLGKGFCEFVEEAGVTMLGTVPSIAKSWRATGATNGVDWSRLRCYASSGEASNPVEYHWLASRVRGYRPIIELSGGTELAGGYVSGSLLQAQASSHFSTRCFGSDIRLLDAEGKCTPSDAVVEAVAKHGSYSGEVAIVPPAMGSSYRLLNRDNDEVYFAGMGTTGSGERLRRHGDMLIYYPCGYVKAGGRTDDTMNLGGIKTSSLEIENVCNAHLAQSKCADAREVAAVAVPPSGGGPDVLWICVAVKGKSVGEARAAGVDKRLLSDFRRRVARDLNPLFKVHAVLLVADLPRTASNKIMRRALKEQCAAEGAKPAAKL